MVEIMNEIELAGLEQKLQDNEIIANFFYPTVALTDIASSMKLIGDKHAKLALEAESAKDARIHLSLAERAFNVSIKAMQILSKPSVDITASSAQQYLEIVFKDGLRRVVRSDLWRLYCVYCDFYELDRARKGEFFALVESLGFVTHKREVCYFVPIKERRRYPALDLNPKLLGIT